MRVLLARHGETPWNAEGRYQGQTDIPLSSVGEEQARKLGVRLADVPIARGVASPLLRARHTAQLALGASRESMLETDAGLLEIHHGTWEGKLAAEIGDFDGERFKAWRHRPESVLMPGTGGESLDHVLARAWPAFERACSGLGDGDTLLVVAHDAVNRVLLCRILGIPLSKVWGFRQAPTTLNLLEGRAADSMEVVRLNDCAHHTALFGEAVHRAL
ncbi:MAG TPA: histidine phosphatase family protein [Xanthomonadaceae bacterium]|jgi:broad specificity phosphatase PhoE|nr:histidine phosphatase family protein [Xanthomonadaceae bacterium]